jgi:hypothetical protein
VKLLKEKSRPDHVIILDRLEEPDSLWLYSKFEETILNEDIGISYLDLNKDGSRYNCWKGPQTYRMIKTIEDSDNFYSDSTKHSKEYENAGKRTGNRSMGNVEAHVVYSLPHNCNSDSELIANYKDYSDTIRIYRGNNRFRELYANHSVINIYGKPKELLDTSIVLTAGKLPVEIDSINVLLGNVVISNKNSFSLPYLITSRDSLILELAIDNSDSVKIDAFIEIISNNCVLQGISLYDASDRENDSDSLHRRIYLSKKDTLVVGQINEISWHPPIPTGESHILAYSIDYGSTWDTIASIDSGDKYSWRMDDSILSTKCLMKLSPVSNLTYKPEIDWVIELDSSTNISLFYPDHNILLKGSNGSYLATTELREEYDYKDRRRDINLYNISPSGKIIWKKRIGVNGRDLVRFLFENDEAYFLIMSSDNYPYNKAGYTEYGSLNIVVAKISKDGQIIWEKSYGGTGWDTADKAVLIIHELRIYSTTRSTDGDYTIEGDNITRSAVLRIDTKTGQLNEVKVFLSILDGYIFFNDYGELASIEDVRLDYNKYELWYKEYNENWVETNKKLLISHDTLKNIYDISLWNNTLLALSENVYYPYNKRSMIKIDSNMRTAWEREKPSININGISTNRKNEALIFGSGVYESSPDTSVATVIAFDRFGTKSWGYKKGEGRGNYFNSFIPLDDNSSLSISVSHFYGIYPDHSMRQTLTKYKSTNSPKSYYPYDTFAIVSPKFSVRHFTQSWIPGIRPDTVGDKRFVFNYGLVPFTLDTIYIANDNKDCFRLLRVQGSEIMEVNDSLELNYIFEPKDYEKATADLVTVIGRDSIIRKLSGLSYIPKISLRRDTIDFDSVVIPNTRLLTKVPIFTNISQDTLEIRDIYMGSLGYDNFNTPDYKDVRVPPGDTFSIIARFEPDTAGRYYGDLKVSLKDYYPVDKIPMTGFAQWINSIETMKIEDKLLDLHYSAQDRSILIKEVDNIKSYIIYDLSGRAIYSSKLDNNVYSLLTIDVSSLSIGTYLIILKSSEGEFYGRFMVY